MRLSGLAVVVAAVLVAACGHRSHELSATDRKLCEQSARQAGAPGAQAYQVVYDACVRTVLHPERGGG